MNTQLTHVAGCLASQLGGSQSETAEECSVPPPCCSTSMAITAPSSLVASLPGPTCSTLLTAPSVC